MRLRPGTGIAMAACALALAAGCSTGGDGPPPPLGGAQAGPGPSRPPAGEMTFDEMELTGQGVLTAEGRFEDVHVTARDVVLGDAGLSAGSMTIDAVVPFDAATAGLGEDVTLAPAGDSRVRVTRTVDVVGRAVDLSAVGQVRAESGVVVVEPTSVDVGGPRWLEELLGDGARRLVTVRHPVEGLPDGLQLDRVSVVEKGFAVQLSGQDVAIPR